MSLQPGTGPNVAAGLQRYVLPTELGPCTVRVQQGTGGRPPASGTPDVYLHGAAGSWTDFVPLLSGAQTQARQ